MLKLSQWKFPTGSPITLKRPFYTKIRIFYQYLALSRKWYNLGPVTVKRQ